MESHSVYEVDGSELAVFKAPGGARASSATKVICRDGHVSYVTAAGKMFSSRVGAGSWYIGRRWQVRDIALIEDAIALGVLPSKDVKALKALKEGERARADRMWAAQNIVDHAKKIGIKFTKAQEALIGECAKRPYNGTRRKSIVDVP